MTENEKEKPRRMLGMVRACNRALVSADDRLALIDAMCRNVVEEGGFPLAWAALDGNGSGAEPSVCWSRERGRTQFDEDILSMPDVRGAMGGTAPVQVDTSRMGETGAAACLVLPLSLDGSCLGLLGVHGADRQVLMEDTAGLRDLAGVLAYGIDALKAREERHDAIESVREGQRALSTLMRNIPGMVYRSANDKHMTMAFVSEGCSELTGYSPSEMMRNGVVRYADLISEEDRAAVESELGEATREDRPYQLEYRIIARTGEEKWVLERGRPVTSFEGERPALEGIVMDITAQKAIEIKANQQTRLAAVGQLAAGIAHDFNNLLTVIIATAELLGFDESNATRSRELESIRKQGEAAARLVRQILDFSRRTVAQRGPLDLSPFLSEAVKLLVRAIPENIRLRTDLGGSCVVRGNPEQLQQALANLVVNARDAMEEGGEITISLAPVDRNAPDPGLVHFARSTGNQESLDTRTWVKLAIADTGTGIPGDVLPHIYDPFYTTKPSGRGTGLGLSQVYGIIKQHDGYIHVDSAPGSGTVFSIFLPLTDVDVGQAKSSAEVHHIQGRGRHILVVEDDEAVLEVTTRMVETLGFRAITASRGQAALEIFGHRRDDIDLVLTDMVMPGMSGTTLVGELRQQKPDVKVVIVTGYAAFEGPGNELPEGVAGYLQKPLTVTRLSRMLVQVLEGYRAGPGEFR